MRDQNVLINNGVDLALGLELFGDMDMYNESLGDFMAEVNEKLSKISRFKEEKDMDNYAIQVHSLKSDAKYFGFSKLSELAFEHETASKQNNTVYVNENYDALMSEAGRIVDVVKQYLSGSVAAPAPKPEPVPESEPEQAEQAAPEIDLEQTIMMPAVNTMSKIEIPVILVVDDSDIIKNFVTKSIEASYMVVTASDGAEAINLLSSNDNISAMVLDLFMPNVDGFKVLEFMKENELFTAIPVSIITGNDDKEVDMSVFEYPIIDILKKPFNEVAVKTIVDRTVNSKNKVSY